MDKWDEFFKVRRNTIFERVQFNRRVQTENESVEQFITSLYNLAENCSYGDLKEELIRDRIVVGIRDKSLSERLQMDEKLTLEDAKWKVRREAVQGHQELLKATVKTEQFGVDAVQRRMMSRKVPIQKQTEESPSSGKCRRCGRGPHTRQMCPAKEAVCHKCKRKGHFMAQCLSKSVGGVTTEQSEAYSEQSEDSEDVAYLNSVNGTTSNSWNCSVVVNGVAIPFKLDTGAEVTVITEGTAEDLNVKHSMGKPKKKLFGADRRELGLLGKRHAHWSTGANPLGNKFLW